MSDPILALAATTLTAIAVSVAVITDLRRRRIPNWLTFPAAAAGLMLWTVVLGWRGLALSLGGMVAAPTMLWLLHACRGPGMGDLKLAAAVGAAVGLALSPVAMLLTALAGGVFAVCWQLRAGGALASMRSALCVGVPVLERLADTHAAGAQSAVPAAIPYAVGIAAGSLLAWAVYWCTGGGSWL
jgi:prepilin peptidase CpaA